MTYKAGKGLLLIIYRRSPHKGVDFYSQVAETPNSKWVNRIRFCNGKQIR